MITKRITIHCLLGFIGLLALTSQSLASPSSWYQDYQGRKAYEQGEFNKAQESFEKVITIDPKAEDYYNLGAAQYRQQDFEGARQNFTAALSAEDLVLKEQAYYNLGNALYRLNQLPESIQAYEEALKLNPQDREAKLNLEFVKRKLQEQKPPEQNPQQEQEGSGEGKGEGTSQEGEKQESQDKQQQNPQGDESKGQEQESKDSGQQDQEKGEQENQQGKEEQPEQGKQDQKEKEESGQGEKQQDQSPQDQAQNQESQNSQSPSEQEKPQEQEKSGDQNTPSGQQDQASQGEKKEEKSSQDSPPREKTPKDLSGDLEAAGNAPESKEGTKKEGMARAEQVSPEAQEAEYLLESVEDKSEEIRRRMIQGAMGRSRTPEKDW